MSDYVSSKWRILQLLRLIPDDVMVRLQYFLKLGRFPNLKSPERYSEKIQQYKLLYRNPRMTLCADKITARKYVEECGYEGILIPVLGVFDSPEEIDFSKLDKPCYLKCSSSSHVNIKYIPGKTNKVDCIKTLSRGFQGNFYVLGREWAYKNSVNRIMAEKLLEADSHGNLDDYKFFCFNGRVELVYVCSDRRQNGSSKISLYDRDFNMLPVTRKGIPRAPHRSAPKNYHQMLEIAERLSREFPHVRVDLYNLDGDIKFGEMTFYTASGYLEFDPDCFDIELGGHFIFKFEGGENG